MAVERGRNALRKINPLLYLSHGGYSILSPEVQEASQKVLQREEISRRAKLLAAGVATIGSFGFGVTETVTAINTRGAEASDHGLKGMVALSAAVVFRAAMEGYTDTMPELTANEKILEAMDSLGQAATLDQILEEVKRSHPSRLNVMFLPRWYKELSRLESSRKIVSEKNKDYAVDDPSNRLYRRTSDSDTTKAGSNS